MDFSVFVLGFLQGISEFLPISSSGHLFLVSSFFEFGEEVLSLTVWLHFCTLLAVLVHFYKKVLLLLKAFFLYPFNKSSKLKESAYLGWGILFATGVSVSLILLFRDALDIIMSSYFLGIAFLLSGLFILFSSRFTKSSTDTFAWWKFFLLGLAQFVAIVPGVSRSGITIGVSLFLKMSLSRAVEISFLLSIPIILASMVFLSFRDGIVLNFSLAEWIAGGLAFLVAWGSIVFMKNLTQRYWIWFGYYCLSIGSLVFLF